MGFAATFGSFFMPAIHLIASHHIWLRGSPISLQRRRGSLIWERIDKSIGLRSAKSFGVPVFENTASSFTVSSLSPSPGHTDAHLVVAAFNLEREQKRGGGGRREELRKGARVREWARGKELGREYGTFPPIIRRNERQDKREVTAQQHRREAYNPSWEKDLIEAQDSYVLCFSVKQKRGSPKVVVVLL